MTPKPPPRHGNQQGSLSPRDERLVRLFEDDSALRYGERTVAEYVAHVRAFLAWAEAKGLTLAGLSDAGPRRLPERALRAAPGATASPTRPASRRTASRP